MIALLSLGVGAATASLVFGIILKEASKYEMLIEEIEEELERSEEPQSESDISEPETYQVALSDILPPFFF